MTAAETAFVWAALGGAPDLADRVSHGPPGGLPAAVPVMALGRAASAACSLAAAELLAVRRGGEVPAVRVDDDAVATAFTSERHLLIDGRPGATFAPLSRFWPAADGWVRTHANYPHHRSRLLAALGLDDSGDTGALVARVAGALATRTGEEVQESVYAAGGLAVAVRSAALWASSEPGRAAAARPLVERRPADTGAGRGSPVLPAAGLPAAGVRVLDLTRVIAGPVATRTLGLLGADVLRIDSPRLPELPDAHADTGFGKRSTALDLARRADRATFEELLATADVVVTGYRPGALDRHGLSAQALLERRPGLIVAQLSAWGFDGPWAERRGFDSLVQAASGIALLQGGPGGRPGALPGQFLDHGTGYLLAAAVLRALTERHTSGGGRHLRLSLATTACWLLDGIPDQDPPAAGTHVDPAGRLAETGSPVGRLRYALPPVDYDGAPSTWSLPPGLPAADPPQWSPAEACTACRLIAGTELLPGGPVLRTGSWVVEHCVGPLGVGTLIVKPIRHVVGVADLTADEAGELGPLLRRVSAAVAETTEPEQVYVCLWSHAGRTPGHIHFVVQPALKDDIARYGAYGPALQTAMFDAGTLPDPSAVAEVCARLRTRFAAEAELPDREGAERSEGTERPSGPDQPDRA